MLRIVIVDDEMAARSRLKRLLAAEPDCTIVGEFADGESAIDGIGQLRPDAVLLDVQMPERNGLEVATAIAGPHAPAVVFVTAFDQYALKAFEVHAVDYLVKPVEAERLRDTLGRLRGRAADPNPSVAALTRLIRTVEELRGSIRPWEPHVNHKRPRDRFLVAVNGRSILVPTAELDWIEAAGNYVRLHRGGTTVMMRESLTSVEASLDTHTFARVHRGAIVNIAKIKEVQTWFSGTAIIILTTGQRLTVSRSHRRHFEARFGVLHDD